MGTWAQGRRGAGGEGPPEGGRREPRAPAGAGMPRLAVPVPARRLLARSFPRSRTKPPRGAPVLASPRPHPAPGCACTRLSETLQQLPPELVRAARGSEAETGTVAPGGGGWREMPSPSSPPGRRARPRGRSPARSAAHGARAAGARVVPGCLGRTKRVCAAGVRAARGRGVPSQEAARGEAGAGKAPGGGIRPGGGTGASARVTSRAPRPARGAQRAAARPPHLRAARAPVRPAHAAPRPAARLLPAQKPRLRSGIPNAPQLPPHPHPSLAPVRHVFPLCLITMTSRILFLEVYPTPPPTPHPHPQTNPYFSLSSGSCLENNEKSGLGDHSLPRPFRNTCRRVDQLRYSGTSKYHPTPHLLLQLYSLNLLKHDQSFENTCFSLFSRTAG